MKFMKLLISFSLPSSCKEDHIEMRLTRSIDVTDLFALRSQGIQSIGRSSSTRLLPFRLVLPLALILLNADRQSDIDQCRHHFQN